LHGTTCEGGGVGGVMLAERPASVKRADVGGPGSKREWWFDPAGLAGRVPVEVPVAAVRGLAGDAERVADLSPAGAPVQRSGDSVIEVGFGGSEFGDGGAGCVERVDTETVGSVHGCQLTLTRWCPVSLC